MIIKKAKKSVKLRKLEALLRMLPPSHPKRLSVETEWHRAHAGYRGEKSVDYFINLFGKDVLFLLHDIRLQHNDNYFQIDILLATRSFLLILEVKNMSGTLIFDRIHKQLIRIKEDQEEVFSDPISQIYRQRYQLKEWLIQSKFPSFPIESLVIIANPSSRIKTIPENTDISNIVMHSVNLPVIIHQYIQNHQKQLLSDKELKRLSKFIVKRHTPDDPDLFTKFHLTENELLKGVRCPNCDEYPMIRRKKQWFCLQCKCFSKDAHVQYLRDYALLIHPTITNSQCCDYLQLSSRSVALHLLQSLNMQVTGVRRHVKYHLDFNYDDI